MTSASRIVATVAVSLIAGFAAGAWLSGDAPSPDNDRRLPNDAGDAQSANRIEARLSRLESAIEDERDARDVLEQELQALIEQIERIDALGAPAIAAQASEGQRSARQAGRRPPRDVASMARNFQERRLGALIEGGFSEAEARRVMQQESEAQYRAMQAAHDRERAGENVDPLALMSGPQALLRSELGDSDYERYLAAQGQPTSVQITQVLESSPGSLAGLQPGDQIVSYNGERVFNVSDLRALTLQGRAGEDVVIEIDRDGMRMQLSIPRGPVGITGAAANIRNMNWWGGG